MEIENTRNSIMDKIIYVSWILMFMSGINIYFSSVNLSSLAIRMNVTIIAIAFIIKGHSINLSKVQTKLIILGFLLMIVQVAGLYARFNSYSLTTTILTCAVFIYIIFTIDIDYSEIKSGVFNILFYFILITSLIDLYLNNGMILHKYSIGSNTLGGMLVFLSIINFILSKPGALYKIMGIRLDLLSFFLLIPLLLSTRARTSVLAAGVIFLTYLFFSKVKIKKKKAQLLYWIIIAASIMVMVIYANLTTYSFYSGLNPLSVQFFEKNIDSSRPLLWKMSWDVIGNHWLLGFGTGTMPSDIMSFGASFHNQFLQLFMQNGLLGLLIFYSSLYVLWKPMADHLDDNIVSICAASFIGIIIYNCFETSLLQNKMALGMIEWQLIVIGVSRALRLNNVSK